MKTTSDVFEFYNNLPTRADQKKFRFKVIDSCGVKKSTWYSWKDRKAIGEKELSIINQIIEEHGKQ